MKKVILLLLMLCFCFGCTKQSLEEQQFTLYHQLTDKLRVQSSFATDYPFQVSLVYNQLDDRYRYDLIIDQVTEDMYDIVAMSYVKNSLDEMYPSLGIFDEEEYHLRKNFVDKANGFYKGVQLSGTCQTQQTVILYISYFTDEKKTNKIEKYIEVKNETKTG